jgi:hypothetical protein
MPAIHHLQLTSSPPLVRITFIPPPASPCRDRAAVVVTAILEMLDFVPRRQLRQHLEALLRDEFYDERWPAIADRSLSGA